ncbi:unnamed protein product [Sympodiomycopsis kandeliae]
MRSAQLQKVLSALEAKRGATKPKAGSSEPSPKKRRKKDDDEDDEVIAREWGNVSGPSGHSKPSDFIFHETTQVEDVRGRHVFVNRAPVMTAWATIVLERLDFNRAEALSLAHCYVAHTATARGVSLGIVPASERNNPVNTVSPNQPHFVLMGVKIPVMQVEGDQWRGISGGETVGPERAFNYLRKSMFQTLPLIMGALTLLADSYVNGPARRDEASSSVKAEDQEPQVKYASGAEHLHNHAYELYTSFRPETGGQWGKRARFELDKVLALRQGHEADWAAWKEKEEGVLAKKEEQADADNKSVAKKEEQEEPLHEEFRSQKQSDADLRSEIESFLDEQERLDAEEQTDQEDRSGDTETKSETVKLEQEGG